jgi:hypothetical protein
MMVKFIQSAVPRAIHKPRYEQKKVGKCSHADTISCRKLDLPQQFFEGNRSCYRFHTSGMRGKAHKTTASAIISK